MPPMRIYRVGGAVRDQLLGLTPKDCDYVVEGETPERMIAAGFKPVGADFPVFLHPITHEEYALARTERKTAPGYKGFVFHTDASVTVEADLARRDLTINAIAQAPDGLLIDPYGGAADIERRVLRHVSAAFAEDPVRVLRLARFAARYAEFTIAPETIALCQQLAAAGELDHLVAERVWQEFAKGLLEAKPARLWQVLAETHALARLLPELDNADALAAGVATNTTGATEATEATIGTWPAALAALNRAAAQHLPLASRWACWLAGQGSICMASEACATSAAAPLLDPVRRAEHICTRLKVPADCRDLAVMACREAPLLLSTPLSASLSTSHLSLATTLADTFQRNDAYRRPARFAELLVVLRVLAPAAAEPIVTTIELALRAALAVDAGALARTCPPQAIAATVREARVAAIARALTER